MPFDPDTGIWTDGFSSGYTGTGKQSDPAASVPAIDTPGQIDPGGNITTTLTGSTPSGSQKPPEAPAPTDTPTAAPPTPTTPTLEGGVSAVNPSDSLVTAQGAAGATQTPTGPSNTLDALTRDSIISLLKTPQTITPESVAASPEAAAERLQSQRSTDRSLAQSAEQAAYDGTGFAGGQEGIQRGIIQAQGDRDAQFAGSLASTLRQQQIGELTQGIQFALQSGEFDKAQALQKQLADIQANEASNSLGLGYAQLQYQANRDAVLAALSGA